MGAGASSKQRYKEKSAPPQLTVSVAAPQEVPAQSGTSSSSPSSPGKRERKQFRGQKLRVQVKQASSQWSLTGVVNGRRVIRWTKSFASEYALGEEVMPSAHEGITVHYAKQLSDGKDCVIKCIKKASSLTSNAETAHAWRLSTEYLLNLPKHESIAELYEVLENSEAYFVVMEKCEGLDLFETLDISSRPERADVQPILQQLLEAVAALHVKGYIHRDIKLENVMLDRSPTGMTEQSWALSGHSQSWELEGSQTTQGSVGMCSESSLLRSTTPASPTVKLFDFDTGEGSVGMSSESSLRRCTTPASPTVKLIDFDTVEDYSPKRTSKLVMGTDMYIAQEVYDGHYSPASDVFAIGVIAYRLLTGKFPYAEAIFSQGNCPGDNVVGSPYMTQTQKAVKHHEIDWTRPPFDSDKEAMELCRWMLAPIDVDRPTAEQAHDHPWFSKSFEQQGPSSSKGTCVSKLVENSETSIEEVL